MAPDLRRSAWIVIAAYNEQPRLGDTLARLLATGYANVVVVDDGSRDDTVAVALRHPVWVLRHLLNLGQGAALQTGIAFALKQHADYIVTFDADGQHDPTEIDRVLAPVASGIADVALGSRFLGATVDMPFARKLVLKGGIVFTRAAAEKVRISQNRMAHASEILDRIREHRLRYVEVPVTIRYSADTMAKGQSSWNAVRIVFDFLLGRAIR